MTYAQEQAMSRRKRWQPPHPDPAKTRIPRCTWAGCGDERALFFPVCEYHAQLISEVMAPREDSVRDTLLAEAHFNKRFLQREREVREARQLAATRGQQPGWIYYVRTDGKIKIGYSTDITKRLRTYPPGVEVLAVHPGTPDLEKQVHRDFDAHRVAGREWFRQEQEIFDHCAKVRDEHGDPARFAPKHRDPHDSNRVVAGKRMNRRW